MMKRLCSIVCVIALLIFTSSCALIEGEKMICSYKTNNYEVKYRGSNIIQVRISRQYIFEGDFEAKVEQKKEEIQAYEKKILRNPGITSEIVLDRAMVEHIITVELDGYDYVNDPFHLFDVTLTEDDVKDVEALRQRLVDQNFYCDPIVP
ncbi:MULTISPECIES: hypothetical protein [Breznakia]|nr:MULTISPECIES: hypothetical protein [Breznakia]MDH6367806.1 hypothetical protein [Breznakia sp. PH1-1]MDH6404897.1 hypothetical protein [Breznakia sp. PF1-11]MDH6412609.1 hypothetical protein [Breznakia sp. PFB1-11]MDH6414972.1 hypothetical protein [Breznakia sp. PFB1-14]MDH6417283.1 hypothetical protein [Breznakia sp. PFB1-4]